MRLWRRRREAARREGQPRLLVPFTAAPLDPSVLQAAIRIARAEDGILVPAYLVVVPLEFDLEAPLHAQVEVAMPMLEAVELAAARAGLPVDARIERGRTPVDALQHLWEVERFDRIIVPAPAGRSPGFTPKELTWMLTNAPSETVILRPDPIAEGEHATAPPAPDQVSRTATPR
jgi:hypothetical protein